MRFWLIFSMFFSFFNSTFSLQHNSLSAVEPKVEEISGTSGTIWSLAVDSQDNVYAGTFYNYNNEGGFYKKNTQTQSFKIISRNFSGLIYSLVADSKNNIYIATLNSFSSVAVLKFTTNGNFQELLGTSGYIRCLAVDSQDNVYAGSENGTVYKSDGTNPFIPMSGTSGGIWSLAVDSQDNVYAASENGTVYKSDGTNPFIPMSGTSGYIRCLAVDSQDNVYAGSYNDNIYKSNSTVYKSNGISDFTAMKGTSGYIRSLAVDSQDNVYAGSENGTVYKSNGISDFTAMKATSASIWSLAVDSQDNVYAGSENGTVYKIYEVEKPQINLNGLTNHVAINNVIRGNLDSFEKKLIEKLQVDQFSILSLNDVDITKSNGLQLVANDIVTNHNVAIKITAKSNSADFTGDKIVGVDLTTIDNRINLSDLNNNIDIDGVHEKDISTFKSAMLAKLKVTSDSQFNNLSLSDFNTTKSDGSQLIANDIVTNPNLAVKLTAKSDSDDFTGFKDINVNLTTIDRRTDLNNLVNPNPITNILNGDLNNFLATLIQQLSQQVNFTILLLEDVDITKGDGSQLTSSDIDNNSNLVIKITAKANNVKFINSKTLTINLTTKDYKFMAVAVANDGTLWVAQNYNNKTILLKSNVSTNNSLFEVKEFDNLTINALVVNNNGIVYIGATNGLYQGNSSNTNFTKIDNISDSVTSLAISSNGTIWVGTKITSTTGKVYQGTNNSFSELSGTTGAVNTIATHNKDVWVGTTSGQNRGGLYKSSNNNTFSQMLTGMTESVQSLAIEKDGIVWIGTKTGFGTGSLYQLQVDNTFNKISSVVNTVSALAIEKDGTLLIGTQTGFGTGELYELEKDNSLNAVTGTTGVISSLVVDSKNKTIWIATTTNLETGTLYQANELDVPQPKSSSILFEVGIIISIFVLLFNLILFIVYLVKNKKKKNHLLKNKKKKTEETPLYN